MYICVYMCVCMYVCVCIYIDTHTHVYVYIYRVNPLTARAASTEFPPWSTKLSKLGSAPFRSRAWPRIAQSVWRSATRAVAYETERLGLTPTGCRVNPSLGLTRGRGRGLRRAFGGVPRELWPAVGSRIGPKGGFGLFPGKLLTLK